jgi:cellulose 1,4-beta-cellobiosidase
MRYRLTALLCAVLLPVAALSPAQAVIRPAVQTCNPAPGQPGIIPVTSPGGHAYEFEGDEYNSTRPYSVCTDGSTSFTVASSSLDTPLGGAPAAYASEYRGNHGYGGPVSPRSGLPVPAASFTTRDPVHLSLSATLPRSGVWDLDFDTFFTPAHAARPGPQTEIMLWLNSAGVGPAGTELARDITLGSHQYNVFGEWTNPGHTVAFVTYQFVTPRTSVAGLGYAPFAAETQKLGFLPASWVLADVEAGYEIWQGGVGASVNSLAVTDPDGS